MGASQVPAGAVEDEAGNGCEAATATVAVTMPRDCASLSKVTSSGVFAINPTQVLSAPLGCSLYIRAQTANSEIGIS